jgi:hypothetical protein
MMGGMFTKIQILESSFFSLELPKKKNYGEVTARLVTCQKQRIEVDVMTRMTQ